MGRASGKCDNIALGSVDSGQCGHFRMYVHTVDSFARELKTHSYHFNRNLHQLGNIIAYYCI